MISTLFEEELSKHEVTLSEFSELLIRLLDYGVIMRGESQIETTLYDRYLQCTEVVGEYLSLIKVSIFHDRQFCFIRAFPPGAIVPGLQSSDDDSAFNSGMRVKPTQQDIAVILVLRVEYEKSLREGSIDEKGCVLLSMEAVSIGLKNLLKRSLPESQGERKAIFRHLRQLRLIKFNSETDLESEDSWLSIQPSISSFVSDEVLKALYPDDKLLEEIKDVL
jgi:hypothetical protein